MAYTDPASLTWATEEIPTAAKMNSATNDQFLALFPDGEEGVSWTPELEATTSNPTCSASGRQFRMGPILYLWGRFVLSAPGSGRYFVTLPATAVGLVSTTAEGSGQNVGGWTARDDSAGLVASGSVILRSATEIQFASSPVLNASMLAAVATWVPWQWDADDVLSFHAVVLTA